MRKIIGVLWLAAVVVGATGAELIPLTLESAENRARNSTYVRLQDGKGELAFGAEGATLALQFADGKLNVDLDGDGKFSSEGDGDPIENGGSVTLSTMLAGRKIDYPVTVQFVSRNRYVMFRNDLVLRGKMGETAVELHDSRLNGRFQDYGVDSLMVGDARVPLKKVVRIEDKLMNVAFVEKKGVLNLSLSPYEKPVGTLRVICPEGWGANLRLDRDDHVYFAEVTEAKQITLPSGEYKVLSSMLAKPPYDAKSGKRPDTYLSGYDREGRCTVDVKAGDNEVKVGLPLKLAAQAVSLSEDKSKVKVTTADLVGQAGECYRALVQASSKTESKLECWVRAGEKSEKLSDMGYG